MSGYAVRKDGLGWRAVNEPKDCTAEEVFSADQPEAVVIDRTREDVEAARLRAYADPITGSDRYFAESARLQVMGADPLEIAVAREAGIARYQAIQEEYPWP